MLSNNSRLLVAFAGALLASTAFTHAAVAQVSTQFVNAQTGTTYTVLNTDCSKLVTFSNASATAITLGQAGTSNKFQQGCFIDFENKGAGVVTITPTTSTINGGTTLVLGKNQGARIVSDGSNYQMQAGLGVGQGTAVCAGTASALECNGYRGQVSFSLTGVGTGVQSLAFTNALAGTTSNLLCTLNGISSTVGPGTSQAVPVLVDCTGTATTVTARIGNYGSVAMSGNAKLDFAIIQ